jgi:hypothetical protein
MTAIRVAFVGVLSLLTAPAAQAQLITSYGVPVTSSGVPVTGFPMPNEISAFLAMPPGPRQKGIVGGAGQKLKAALEGLGPQSLSRAKVATAREAYTEFATALTLGAAIQRYDADYHEFATQQFAVKDSADAEITLARQRLEFLRGPGAIATRAQLRMERAGQEKSKKRRKALEGRARELFAECVSSSERLFEKAPALVHARIALAGDETKPGDVIDGCRKGAEVPPPKKAPVARKRKPGRGGTLVARAARSSERGLKRER